MKKIKFELEEKTKANKVFLVVEFAGGDADTEHPEEYEISDLTFLEISTNGPNDELIKLVKDFKILKGILDVNSKDYIENYEDVIEEHGTDIARLYDNAPNDPQTDYDTKCYISRLHLIGYDNEGNMYKSYL